MALTTDRALLLAMAVRDIRSGTRREDVVEMLVNNGMLTAEAEAEVQKLTGTVQRARWSAAFVGLLIAAFGGSIVYVGTLGMMVSEETPGHVGWRTSTKIAVIGALVLLIGGRQIVRAFSGREVPASLS